MPGRRQAPDSSAPPDPRDVSDRPRPGLTAGLSDYLSARAELLGIEAREAAVFAGQRGVLGVLLGVVAFFAYALFLVVLVLLLARGLAAALPPSLAPFGTELSAALFGAVHLVLAFVLLRKLRQPPKPPLFELTRSEFQKDRQWLKPDKTRNESDS